MKRVSPGVARRYARALLDVALAQGDPPALGRELAAAARTIAAHPELAALLAHPAVPVEKKKAVVAAVFKDASASDIRGRLLTLLAERDRLELLPAIAESYAALLNAHNNVAAAEVVSAVALDQEQVEGIGSALRKATGMGVEVKMSVDPALLGGILVKIGGRHFDGSVRGRLRALRAHLAGAQGSQ